MDSSSPQVNINTTKLTLRELKKLKKMARKKRGNPEDATVFLRMKVLVANRTRKHYDPKPRKPRR